jgi:hypothetical protein
MSVEPVVDAHEIPPKDVVHNRATPEEHFPPPPQLVVTVELNDQ